MSAKRKLIFKLNTKEREDKLKAVLMIEMEKAAALNLPVIYRNELCVKPNLFIHKYPNGRITLIEQNSKDFSEKTIMVLSNANE